MIGPWSRRRILEQEEARVLRSQCADVVARLNKLLTVAEPVLFTLLHRAGADIPSAGGPLEGFARILEAAGGSSNNGVPVEARE